MNTDAAQSVLSVSLSDLAPAESQRLETKSGPVSWAFRDGTLLLYPERGINPSESSDTARLERLVRTVMKSSGLARRYQAFSFGKP